MSDEEDYSSSDDLDYVPSAGEEVSEEEGSGDEEDLDALREDAKEDGKIGKKRQRKKKTNELAPRKRQGGIKLDGNEEETTTNSEAERTDKINFAEEIAKEKEVKKEEQEKKKADSLWASFLSDVKPPPKKPSPAVSLKESDVKPNSISRTTSEVQENSRSNNKSSEKVTITKIFDFAGEEVRVTKEVDAASKEAQQENKKEEITKEKKSQPSSSESSVLASIGIKRPAPTGGGLGGILNKLGKKPKISVLDKSKMDWESFKKDEGIEDDLKIHNRGKESYLERMAFLNRADVRQFEVEKSLRLGSSKR